MRVSTKGDIAMQDHSTSSAATQVLERRQPGAALAAQATIALEPDLELIIDLAPGTQMRAAVQDIVRSLHN